MPIDVQDSTPLYLQIVDDIKSKIASKELKAGDQLGSHAALSSAYRVSLITVKKALATLNNDGVVFSRVGKGTYVAQHTIDARQNGHPTIGLVIRDVRSPFFSRVMHSVEDAAYELGYHVLVSNSSGKAEKEEAQIARFREFGVNGMIIASMTHKYHPTPTVRKMLHQGFPFVMVSFIADEDVPFVGSDHEQGGYLATEYLMRQGYQKIGYINGERGNMVGELRRRGYEHALKDHGRRVDKNLLFHLRMRGEHHDYQSGYEIGKKIATLRLRPDAVFVYNDLSALGFEDAILEHGLRIPDDIAIVGFDDIERGEYAPVSLSTVRQPTSMIGKEAVSLLLKLMQGKNVSIRRVLKTKLVIRGSSGRKKVTRVGERS
ncbi:MAG: GntR family transcriptional regulator [Ignavibacteriales bacterium]|nr:GntR family transcriptional regulator [Ignavibacteriales bacterium]